MTDLRAPIRVNVVYMHRLAARSACLGLCWLQPLRAGADGIVRDCSRAVLRASYMAGTAVAGLACPEEVAGGRGLGVGGAASERLCTEEPATVSCLRRTLDHGGQSVGLETYPSPSWMRGAVKNTYHQGATPGQ